jgi:hypothetical protein
MLGASKNSARKFKMKKNDFSLDTAVHGRKDFGSEVISSENKAAMAWFVSTIPYASSSWKASCSDSWKLVSSKTSWVSQC